MVQLEGNPVRGDNDCFGGALDKYLVFAIVELKIKNILNVELLKFLHIFISSLRV